MQPLTKTLSDPTAGATAQATARRSRHVGAILVGSDYRALAVARSLGRRRIPVFVLQDGADVLAAASRYATRRQRLAGRTDASQSAFLLDLADRHHLDAWVVFPTSDTAAAMVGRHHAQLATRLTLTTPPWSVLRWAYDKRLTYRLAESLGLAHPATRQAASGAEAASLPLDYPVIIKPAVKERRNRLTDAKAWRADNPCELALRFDQAAELVDASELLIQDMIPGGGETQVSFAALCDHGRPLATVTARRTRQYPVDLGRASSYVETTDQPEIIAPATRWLEEVGFTGLVEVEFKRDPRDGAFKLLDVNPRVWGWHSVCQRAGLDLPFLAWRLALGEPVTESHAQPGVRWLRLSTDLPTALREIVGGRLSARQYVASLRSPHDSAIFARDDPWPALLEYPILLNVLKRRLLHGNER